jgi:hypothetical protein
MGFSRHSRDPEIIDAYLYKFVDGVPGKQSAVCVYHTIAAARLGFLKEFQEMGVGKRFAVPAELESPCACIGEFPYDGKGKSGVRLQSLQVLQVFPVGQGEMQEPRAPQFNHVRSLDMGRVEITVHAPDIASVGYIEISLERTGKGPAAVHYAQGGFKRRCLSAQIHRRISA